MQVPKLTIGQFTFDKPIVQGAMGVRISSYPLPPMVANLGGWGMITTIGLGGDEAVHRDYPRISNEALVAEIERCCQLSTKPMAVNVMGALSNVNDLIDTAVRSGIKIVVYGAGIPLDLPKLVPDLSVNLVPIVSSARLVRIILSRWAKKYQRLPAAFVLEGPLAGGHLGFNQYELDHPEIFNLKNILAEVLAVVRPYEQMFGQKIPVIVAGGILIADVPYWLSLGAAAVQLGTLFVMTDECPAAPEFKQAYLEAKPEDVHIIHSPVGLLGRVIHSPFLDKVAAGQVKIECPYHCITSCEIKTARFCIARALYNAKLGLLDDGLIFAGANVHLMDRIIPVSQLMAEIIEGIEASPLS